MKISKNGIKFYKKYKFFHYTVYFFIHLFYDDNLIIKSCKNIGAKNT